MRGGGVVHSRKGWIGVAAIGACVFLAAGPAAAQQGPGGLINPQKDCQTIVNCQFKRGASWRGCVSSYSCRRCDFVPARCRIAGAPAGVCRKLVCRWGG